MRESRLWKRCKWLSDAQAKILLLKLIDQIPDVGLSVWSDTMTLNEYFEYIRNPLAESKARVVIVPPGESWTALRRFCQERGYVELRLSDLVREGAWLPMPDEVFGRVRDAIMAEEANSKPLVLLGIPGYLALLTDENKRAAIIALHEWLDSATGREAVCFLRSDDGTGIILKDVFANPRYRQGRATD